MSVDTVCYICRLGDVNGQRLLYMQTGRCQWTKFVIYADCRDLQDIITKLPEFGDLFGLAEGSPEPVGNTPNRTITLCYLCDVIITSDVM